MAYRIIREDYLGDSPDKIVTVIMDSVSDLTDLGTSYSAGSVAKIAGGDIYTMSASGTWTKEE